MASIRRIVPEWKTLLPQLKQKIHVSQKGGSPGRLEAEEEAVYVDASPAMIFHFRCAPNYLRCLTTFTSGGSNVTVGFLWGHRLEQHRMDVWIEEEQGPRHNQSFPLEMDYLVERLLFVPCQRLFVGYCNDLALRLYGDLKQEMSLLYRADCPSSVFSLHYSQESGEIITGGVGIIAFWSFWPSPRQMIGVTHVLDWTCCSLERGTFIKCLATEPQSFSLYALCDAAVKVFNYQSKEEMQPYSGTSSGTLLCCSPCWVQRYLYTGDSAGHVQVWSRDTHSLLQEFRAHSRGVTDLALCLAGLSYLTVSADGWLKEWSYSGELLHKLFVDEAGLLRMCQLGNDRVLLQGPCAFSIWKLCSICSLFNATGWPLRRISRVQAGPGRARLLVITQDGIACLLSPVTGEMLLLSWPFLLLEEALDYAYDLRREELFVATGSPHVLVLDTSRCPCPAKHFLVTSREWDDGVLCLEAVTLGPLSACPPCLIFGGHKNGKIGLLSPQKQSVPSQKAHNGAILQMSSCVLGEGDQAQLCCYGTDQQLSVWAVRQREHLVHLLPMARIPCSQPLLLTQLLPGQVCAVSQDSTLMFFSLTGGCAQAERPQTPEITSLDYCASLGVIVTAGPQGMIEVWDSDAKLLAEISLGEPLSHVCFANPRGDLLANFHGHTYLILSVHFLPPRFLSALLFLDLQDDATEAPLPFQLGPPDTCCELVFIPRYHLDLLKEDKEQQPSPEAIAPCMSTTPVRPASIVRLVQWRQRETEALQPAFVKAGEGKEDSVSGVPLEPERQASLQAKEEAVLEDTMQQQSAPNTQTVDLGQVLQLLPIADGYIPNSVIRAWGQQEGVNNDQDSADKMFFIQSLEKLPRSSRKVHSQSSYNFLLDGDTKWRKVEEGQSSGGDSTEIDLLTQIANSLWLAKKPRVLDWENMIRALLDTMALSSSQVYQQCEEALLNIMHTYSIPPEHWDTIQRGLLGHTRLEEPIWKRLEGWRSLDQLTLLSPETLPQLAQALMDPSPAVDRLAKALLQKWFQITEKSQLLRQLEGMQSSLSQVSSQLLQRVQDCLTQHLDLDTGTPSPDQSHTPADWQKTDSQDWASGVTPEPERRASLQAEQEAVLEDTIQQQSTPNIQTSDLGGQELGEGQSSGGDSTEIDLLTQISNSMWLAKKPRVVDQENVIQTLLDTMALSSSQVYQQCEEALLNIMHTYSIPPALRDTIQRGLLGHTRLEEPNWKRLEGWRSLDQLTLLSLETLPQLAQALMDPSPAVDRLARALLQKWFQITEKSQLLRQLEGMQSSLDLEYSPPGPRLGSPGLEEQCHAPTPLLYVPSSQVSSQLLQRVQDCLTQQLDLDTGTPSPDQSHPPADWQKTDSQDWASEAADREGEAVPVQKQRPLRGCGQAGKLGRKYFPVLQVYVKKARPQQQLQKNLIKPMKEVELGRRVLKPIPLPTPWYSRVASLSSQGPSLLSSQAGPCLSIPEGDPPDFSWGSKVEPGPDRDPRNWRANLYKLTSLYGFRSPRAQKGAPLLLYHGQTRSVTLPRLTPPPMSHDPLPGQRVLCKVGVQDPREKHPSRFQHELPLPWQLNSLTLTPQGESD